MKKIILISVIALIVGIGGYLLLRGGDQYQDQAPVSSFTPAPGVDPGDVEEKIVSGETPEITELEGITPPPASSEVKKFTVSGTEYSFSPSLISIETGDLVEITFRNIGRLSHDLVIEGLGIKTRIIGAGQTDVVKFTASTTGSYTIFCSVPGHRVAGMEGELEVK